MLRHLLVPLDGSREAESSLAVAAPIARRTGAFVTLLHVLEPEVPAGGQSALVHEHDVQEYLAHMVRWLDGRGVRAARLVREAMPSVAAAIAAVGIELGADLMVLSSRGRGKVHDIELGRLAREVLVSGTVPFLLVRPFVGGRDHAFGAHRLLVPVDGSERAEVALPTAHMLAEGFGGELLLLWVLPVLAPVSQRQPSDDRSRIALKDRPDDIAGFVQRYLDVTARGLGWGEVAVATQVARGEPVRAILETAQTWQADIIVLASHGRTGDPTVWAGSVASRLVDHNEYPVLIVRSPR